MSSTNYSLQSDSVNISGVDSSSTNYRVADTVGEVGTGLTSSTNYSLYGGYQQMQEVFLSISAVSDVTMSPSLGGTSGGTANGAMAVTVTTDDPAGYTLSISASTSPAMTSGANSIADYTPAGAVPDFDFTVAATDSEFGFTPEGTDIAARYKDNGSACNTGASDTVNQCWDPLTTSLRTIAGRTSGNHPSGTATTVKFRLISGASHVQANGTYRATSTVTALAL